MAGGLLDLDLKLLGARPLVRQLGLARDRVGDLRPAWDAIHHGRRGDPLLRAKGGRGGLSFVETERAQFATKGARGGERWPGYDGEPRYRVIKRLFGGGEDNIMRWVRGHERLFPSLVVPTHPEHVYEPSALAVSMGTRVPYARRHQEGSGEQPFDRVPLKRRRLVAPTEGDLRAWTRTIQRHVMWPLSPEGRIRVRGPAGRGGS